MKTDSRFELDSPLEIYEISRFMYHTYHFYVKSESSYINDSGLIVREQLGQEEDEFMSVYDSNDSLKIANKKGKKDCSNSEPEEIDWSSMYILKFDDAVCLAQFVFGVRISIEEGKFCIELWVIDDNLSVICVMKDLHVKMS